MTLNPNMKMLVVKREDKEAKLKALISHQLAMLSVSPATDPWLLVARSAESPVVQALASLAAEINGAGITVQTLLTQQVPGVPDSAVGPVWPLAGEVRLLSDVRLLDAHEQLRFDAKNSWVGDCMRREPAKRDAYECYADDCPRTARWSATAFARLWEKGEPILMIAPLPAAEERATPAIDEFPVPSTEIPSTVVASTRH